ncbi:MFS transporter [Nonomuraea turcica]|uniref:MFS transporter n=1 Tax=Nonomuraea sp. G32 TaxID=3067274 RepID=UPI00273C990B|nr:MFS transporter [Nonomuraea sp. G32]MDP4508923.1 MFS transporter [Nonomuraea sp. G32]
MRRGWVLALASMTIVLVVVDLTAVTIALPDIRADLGASLVQVQWVVDAYALTLAAALLPAGVLADRYGRRRLLVIGVSIFTVASLACALAPTAPLLDLARGVQGLGASALYGTTTPLIGAAYPEGPDRGKALGIFSAVSGLAMTLGPVVGGALTSAFGWRAIFLINLPIGAFVLVALRQRVAESRGRGHLDPLGILLITAALFAIIPALIHDLPALLVAGLVLLAVFVLVERRASEPMIDLGLFRNRVFAVGSGTTLLMLAALLGAFTYLTLYVQGPLDTSPAEAGARFLAFSVAAVIGPVAIGRVLHKWPMGVLIAVGPAVIAVALLVMAVPAADPWTPIMVGLFLGGLGLGAGNVVANQVGLTAPMDRVGMATGIVNTLKQVGTAVGVAVLAAPYRSGLVPLLLIAAALALAGALLPVALRGRSRPATPPPAAPYAAAPPARPALWSRRRARNRRSSRSGPPPG